jgi:hypothetical protein
MSTDSQLESTHDSFPLNHELQGSQAKLQQTISDPPSMSPQVQDSQIMQLAQEEVERHSTSESQQQGMWNWQRKMTQEQEAMTRGSSPGARMAMAYEWRIQPATPNGQCQFIALAHTMFTESAFSTAEIRNETQVIKQLAKTAFEADSTRETKISNIQGITTDDPSQTINNEAAIREYLKEIVQTQPNRGIRPAMWGGMDTLRWISKALNRAIGVLSEDQGKGSLVLWCIPQAKLNTHIWTQNSTVQSPKCTPANTRIVGYAKCNNIVPSRQ